MKKSKFLTVGVLASTLALGLVLAGCPTDGGGGNNNNNNNSGTSVPSAPIGVTATALSSSSINVSWNSVSEAISYKVYSATSSSGAYTLDGTATTTSFTSTGWGVSETGYFKVTAVNSYGESGYSSTASATTSSSPGGGTSVPIAPTGVTATALSSSSISVSWNSVSGATSYDVYYEIGSSSTKNFAGNTTNTSYTHSGLTASTTYYYYIKAKNSVGESGYSSFDSATTSSSGGGNTGGTTVEYRLDQPIFGTSSRSGNNLSINWTLSTSGKTPNGLYTYTSPSSIIIQTYNGTSFDDFATLSGSARSYTLNNYSVFAYSPAGVSGNRVTIRVLCKSTYGDRYSTITYFVEQNSFTPSY
jgi:cellulose 1,4-beta-cellobiosidase